MIALESAIRERLLPAILGREATDNLRLTYSLPARLGGLGIQIPTEEADFEFQNSILMTGQITEAIYQQQSSLTIDVDEQSKAAADLSLRKSDKHKATTELLKSRISEAEFRMLELASEKGASLWLTSLPLAVYGFRLNKQQFADAICLRYNLPLHDVPRKCMCGVDYSIEHCLTCKNGGYVHLRHNAVRDSAHELLQAVCKDVRLEPSLLPVTGEALPASANRDDGARADISAVGLWIPLSRAFFDVKVVNPLARTNWNMKLNTMYRHHESLKNNAYRDRILQVDKGSFTPLVFSCTGGAAPEATKFIKQLALKLSLRKMERYSETVSYLRRRFSFEILRTCVISLQGERGKPKYQEDIMELDIELCATIE